MENKIKIWDGKLGCFLTIGNKAVKTDGLNNISLNNFQYEPNNWIASEFVSVKAIRDFWAKHRIDVIALYNK